LEQLKGLQSYMRNALNMAGMTTITEKAEDQEMSEPKNKKQEI